MNSSLFDLSHATAPPPDIAEALSATAARRGAFGSPLIYAPSLASTNDIASRLADAGAAEGTTVVADAQTAGRGRLGRTWFSPEGAGLYVSVVVRPYDAGGWKPRSVSADTPPLPAVLTLVAGVALAEAIREATGLAAEIKWPNDLMCGRRKLAGILAEASGQGPRLDYVVLGLGINVRAVSFPPEMAARATSIEGELGRHVDRGLVLAGALAHLATARARLRRGEIGAMLARWRELSPTAVGSPVEWRRAEGLCRGTTAGLDTDGALLVDAAGVVERVVAGEIIWR
ncbi:MAG: biotin--[acetyl-CoA-carboxylase] ligase [Acidobacteria bacterium]|nr:biotin--[acetyl-CoA-carboxylase] ligase [Acidobacteriota bacterium]